MVFYAAFPLALVVARTLAGRILLAALGGAALCAFSFQWLSPTGGIDEQWRIYINPLNQFPFFLAGMLIAFAVVPRGRSWPWVLLALAAALAFWLVPVGVERAALVTGPLRLALTALCMTLVLAMYASGLTLNGWAHLSTPV